MKDLNKIYMKYFGDLIRENHLKLSTLNENIQKDKHPIEILESNDLRLKIVLERNIINFDFQPISSSKNEWYDVDIIKNVLDNSNKYKLYSLFPEIENPYDLKVQRERTEIEAEFIKQNIERIADLFNENNVNKNIKLMKIFREQRAKELFG